MSRDTPVDWTQLTDPEQALRWSLRGEDDYDSYQKDNQFVARVIFADDVHSKVSASELLAVFGTMVSSGSAAEVRKFRGRIIGKNSPHSFLPDPCNPDFQGAEFEELTKNLINLHTLFYVMNADGATPNVDSYWLVTLNASGCPGAPFNLQFAQAIEVISETEKQVAAAEKACEALEKLDWDGGSPLGTYGSNGSRRSNRKSGHHSSGGDIVHANLYPRYDECDPIKATWTKTTWPELARAIRSVVGGNRSLGASILTIAMNEQPSGEGPDYNFYGIMGDIGSWGSCGDKHIKCVSVAKEGEAGAGTRVMNSDGNWVQQRYFVAFASIEDGVKLMACILRAKKWQSTSGEQWVRDYWHKWGGEDPASQTYKDHVKNLGPGQIANYNKASQTLASA